MPKLVVSIGGVVSLIKLTAKNTTTNFDTAQCHVLDGHGSVLRGRLQRLPFTPTAGMAE